MKYALRLVRFPNLIIVGITQYALQYGILCPIWQQIGVKQMFPPFQFFWLTLTTILIAASGYVVNDIEDVEIDRLNKPEHKRIVGKIYPLSICWKIYYILVIFGFIMNCCMIFYISDFIQILIYPFAVLLLWAYSKWFKRQFLIGNIVVAGFCAFVAWVVFYFQSLSMNDVSMPTFSDIQRVFSVDTRLFTPELDGEVGFKTFQIHYVISIFIGYGLFAFISTLFREIIKDIEDVWGDKAQGCQTLPVVIGVEASRKVALGVGIVFVSMIIFCNFLLKNHIFKILILDITILLPLVYTLYLLSISKEKTDFAFISKLSKLIMLSGLIFILLMKV